MSILKRELAEEETSHMTSIIEPFDEEKFCLDNLCELYGDIRPRSRPVAHGKTYLLADAGEMSVQ